MKTISLSRGLVAVIDDADFALVVESGPWHAAPGARTFYARRNARRDEGGWVSQCLHKFLTGWPTVDHADGDGLNNQRSNLRPASAGQNAANRPRRIDSTSGFKGVCANKSRGLPWRAQICAGYRKRHLGLFVTPEEAARAYDAAARDLFGAYARLNFPTESAQ